MDIAFSIETDSLCPRRKLNTPFPNGSLAYAKINCGAKRPDFVLMQGQT
jgi:hypothetical protein